MVLRTWAFAAVLLVVLTIATTVVRADEEEGEEATMDEPEPVVCPTDVTECWDGSVLTRDPEYDCEFYPYECPSKCWFRVALHSIIMYDVST